MGYDVCLRACGNVQATAWKASDKKAWRNPSGQSTQILFVDFGNLAIIPHNLRAWKTHGFASPPLDGLAFIVFLSGSIIIKTVFIPLQIIYG